MSITGVRVRTVPFTTGTWLDEQRVATPMSRYPEYAARRSSWRGPGADLVWVCVETDDPDVYGIGQSRGGKVTAALIEHHLSGMLIGRDPDALGTLVEQLRRACAPYADGGIAAMGVSAIELALWDLSARSVGLPLRRLFGGGSDPLRYYLTVPSIDMLDRADPALLGGAETVKIAAAHGPADGARALERAIADVAAVRERIPAHVGISVDCFMAWDLRFAVEFAREAAQYGLHWIEEPLPPLDFDGYAELRRRVAPVLIAGGEHLFSLRDGARFLRGRCADVFQIDATWCGGLTVASTLGRLAVDAGITFAPHAAGLQPWSLHLASAFGPDALVEVLLREAGDAHVPVVGEQPGVGITRGDAGFD